MENKRDKFTRIAENRTNKIIHMVELLGNCSNKRVYDYTDEQGYKTSVSATIENGRWIIASVWRVRI